MTAFPRLVRFTASAQISPRAEPQLAPPRALLHLAAAVRPTRIHPPTETLGVPVADGAALAELQGYARKHRPSGEADESEGGDETPDAPAG